MAAVTISVILEPEKVQPAGVLLGFVSKEMPLLFNMLSRIVMAFFPRSKYLNFTAAVSNHSDSGA